MLTAGALNLRDAGLGWGNLFWILVPIAGLIMLIALWAQPTKGAVAPMSATIA